VYHHYFLLWPPLLVTPTTHVDEQLLLRECVSGIPSRSAWPWSVLKISTHWAVSNKLGALAEWIKWVEHLPSKCEALSSNSSTTKKQQQFARHWWLMSIILATQEIEIRSIKVWSQPRQIVLQNLSQKTFQKKGMVDRPWVQTPILQKKKHRLGATAKTSKRPELRSRHLGLFSVANNTISHTWWVYKEKMVTLVHGSGPRLRGHIWWWSSYWQNLEVAQGTTWQETESMPET
jgi:hypothetical protein